MLHSKGCPIKMSFYFNFCQTITSSSVKHSLFICYYDFCFVFVKLNKRAHTSGKRYKSHVSKNSNSYNRPRVATFVNWIQGFVRVLRRLRWRWLHFGAYSAPKTLKPKVNENKIVTTTATSRSNVLPRASDDA